MNKLPEYRMVRWLFPRLLAGIYLIAFVSWGVQYRGLAGENGIVPAPQMMERWRAEAQESGESRLLMYPTLQWCNASDGFAMGLIWLCCGASLLVMAGVAQRWLLMLLWAGYLSLAVTGDVFMGFQWDALLLEAGLLAVWLAPGRLWAWRGVPAPPRGSVFLLHWLGFRLMFLSGLVKIGGGDAVWRNMTALKYHFETQPLPNLAGYWAHQWAQEWPAGFAMAACWLMFAVELLLPFAIFLGRWGRMAACFGFVGLMAAIFATGNYTFFNLLAVALAFTLLDDSWWPGRTKRWLGACAEGDASPVAEPGRRPQVLRRLRIFGSATVVTAVTVLTLLATDRFLIGRIPGYARVLPVWAHEHLYVPLAPLRSFNAYGLFQMMTVERPEVILEVSDDGVFWRELQFKFKPGNRAQAPRFVAPHQPRLDWQMWFAALSGGFIPQRDMQAGSPMAWFGGFLGALLQQKQPVWDLLEPPPLPQKDIRYIRARLYRYHFTDWKTRAATQEYWTREYLGPFSPTFSVRSGM